jgi:hypothetical protein
MFSQHFTTLLRRASTAGVVVAASMTAGTVAWAAPAPPPPAESTSAEVLCPYEVTADWLRHRTSPEAGKANALGQYAEGTVVLARRDVVVNGFRGLGNGEWAFDTFLERSGPCLS